MDTELGRQSSRVSNRPKTSKNYHQMNSGMGEFAQGSTATAAATQAVVQPAKGVNMAAAKARGISINQAVMKKCVDLIKGICENVVHPDLVLVVSKTSAVDQFNELVAALRRIESNLAELKYQRAQDMIYEIKDYFYKLNKLGRSDMNLLNAIDTVVERCNSLIENARLLNKTVFSKLREPAPRPVGTASTEKIKKQLDKRDKQIEKLRKEMCTLKQSNSKGTKAPKGTKPDGTARAAEGQAKTPKDGSAATTGAKNPPAAKGAAQVNKDQALTADERDNLIR